MCGLTGILMGKSFRDHELDRVKTLFTQVLIAHEERGKEATGVTAIWPDSTSITVKMPVRAQEFVVSPEYRGFLDKLDNRVSILLGHTRKPTKGSVWNAHNNHPLIVDDTVGVHNGIIHNDDSLFQRENLKRKGEVDSEIIFSMINKIPWNYRESPETFKENIQRFTIKITGSFSTLSVNLKYPHTLLLLKYNQPLSYHYSKSLDSLFFTSRYIFLRKAFGRSVITEALSTKSGYLFNLHEPAGEKGQPVMTFPIVSAEEGTETGSVML